MESVNSVRQKHPDAILGGRVVNANHQQQIQHAGHWWSEAELEWHQENYIEIKPDATSLPSQHVDWLSFAVLLIPRTVWLTVGGFDLRFGSFLADADWCLRARKAGFECLLVNNARFIAREVPMLGDPSEYDRLRSALRFARKHSLPYGMWRLVMKRTLANLDRELILVGFWTDYGIRIGLPKRVFWYLRNIVQALTRERLRNSIKQTFRAAREASITHPAEVA